VRLVRHQLDSRAGSWAYHEWHPPALAGVVELMWQSDGVAFEPVDRHFPSPSVELLVNVSGDRFRLLDPGGAEFFDDAWLAGVQVGPVVSEVPRSATVLGVPATTTSRT
jgi:hypothetical protein